MTLSVLVYAFQAMEAYGCWYGLIAYQIRPLQPVWGSLSLPDIRDRAIVIADEAVAGVTYRVRPSNITLRGARKLTVVVENMGRINFSHGMDDGRKGIVRGVRRPSLCAHIRQ